VTIFARLLLRRDHATARAFRLLASTLAGSAAAAVLLSASPAHAAVVEVAKTKVGLQAVNEISYVHSLVEVKENAISEKLEVIGNPAQSFGNSTGAPVVHGASVWVIYWDPKDLYHGDWQHLVNTFLQNVGTDSGSRANVFSVNTQYTDASNIPAYYQSPFRGAYTDTHPYPVAGCASPLGGSAVTCLTDSQLREQLQEFIVAHGLPKGMGTIYYVLTPPAVTVCIDGGATRCSDFTRSKVEEEKSKYESASYLSSICSYHADINPDNVPNGDANTILYAAIPWSAGAAGQGVLANTARQAAYCQDGGFNAASKPIGEREKVKPRTPQEQKEFEEKTAEERLKLEEQKALQGPHAEEPNQAPCPSPDGLCDTGLADLIVNQVAVEQQNIVTDPLLNAWQDEQGKEATDECRNFFAQGQVGGGVTASPESGAGSLFNQTVGGHNYYLNMAFNLAALRLPYPGVPCIPGDRLEPQFTSPSPVNSGEVVGFDGMESDISLNAAIGFSAGGAPQPNYATYAWNFGDGTAVVTGYAPGAPACETPWLSPCAASVFHAFQYGGTYSVTLTVTDVGAHTVSVTNPITVNGPAAPKEAAPKEAAPGGSTPSTPSTAGGGGSSSTASGSGSPHSAPIPAPVATAAVVSHSLRRALRGGLVVRYSVNEQVAGHFEVLLSRSIARRLGIGGSPAIGLPAGTPPQVIIGRAVLVTTSAGRSTVVIQFSKRTASRLARLHSVPLMLRLFVRNAASHSPATTTVLSTVTLSH
jgi:hypothetical protein